MQCLTVRRVRRPHPLYAAPSARHYLQFQRRVHASIAQRRVAVETEYFQASPALAPDLTKCAIALAQPVRLRLLELPGQDELGCWPLPRLTNESCCWLWRNDSRCLAAPWGRCWSMTGVVGAHAKMPLLDGPCGVSMLDICTGTVANVALGAQPSRYPRIGGWTDSGLLAVRYVSSGVMVWSLFTAFGNELYAVVCPQQAAESGISFACMADSHLVCGRHAIAPVGDRLLLSMSNDDKPDRHFIWHWIDSSLVEAKTRQDKIQLSQPAPAD